MPRVVQKINSINIYELAKIPSAENFNTYKYNKFWDKYVSMKVPPYDSHIKLHNATSAAHINI